MELQLSSAELQCEIKWLRDTARESYGPMGRLSLLHPFPGAELTCTNRSLKLLQLLKPTSPVTKLILTSLQLHCQHFKEATLYAALLTTNLILRGLELPYPKYKVAMVTGYVLSEVCDWLEHVECLSKRQVSLTSTEGLMALVKTHLASKMTVYGLTNTQLEHISSLLLQGFLRVAPSNSEESFSFIDHLHILSCPGHAVQQSVLLGGVVLPTTTDDPIPSSMKRCRDGSILVALFDVSMAGDLEEFPVGVSLEAESNSGLPHTIFDDVIVDKLMGVGSHLVNLGVGLVGCQKCVHPQVKEYLREQGAYVLERLSSLYIGPMKSLTGTKPLSSLSDGVAVSPSQLGRLKELRLLTVLGETYLQLEGVSDDHCSIILTSHLKGTSDEMTALCNDTVSILEHTLRSPFVFYGGGCMETITAQHLKQKANEITSDDVLMELQCNQKTLSAVTLSIAESFIATAECLEHDRGTIAIDSAYHHCWSHPPISEATPTFMEVQSCRCGAVTSSMLPADCRWTEVAGNGLVQEHTKNRNNDRGFPPDIPTVSDCYIAKLRATELTGDIASTVLQTAWIATMH